LIVCNILHLASAICGFAAVQQDRGRGERFPALFVCPTGYVAARLSRHSSLRAFFDLRLRISNFKFPISGWRLVICAFRSRQIGSSSHLKLSISGAGESVTRGLGRRAFGLPVVAGTSVAGRRAEPRSARAEPCSARRRGPRSDPPACGRATLQPAVERPLAPAPLAKMVHVLTRTCR